MTLADSMQTPISELSHMLPGYDPVRAHEYYLKTRKLKGRQPGAKPVPLGRPAAKAKVVSHPDQTKGKPKKTAAHLKTEVDAQVAALQAKLTKLKNLLAELTKQAQARSGVTTAKATAAKSAASNKPQTAAQKKAAKDAHAYYEAHKSQAKAKASTPAEQEKQLQAQIKQVEAQIEAIRQQLAEAAKKVQAAKPRVETAA